MKYPVLVAVITAVFLLSISPRQVVGQSRQQAAGTSAYIPWFTVQNKAIVVQNCAKTKALTTDITLPNGTRIDHRTQLLTLANGTRVAMKEGDMLSLTGDFIRKAPEPETPESAPVLAASVPAAAPEPTAAAPAVDGPASAPTEGPVDSVPAAPQASVAVPAEAPAAQPPR